MLKKNVSIQVLKEVKKEKRDKRFLIKRSVNVEDYHYKFLNKHEINLSELVRTLLDQLIEAENDDLELPTGS